MFFFIRVDILVYHMTHVLVARMQHVEQVKPGAVTLAEIYRMVKCHLCLLRKIAAI
jgi:hypothetical protein